MKKFFYTFFFLSVLGISIVWGTNFVLAKDKFQEGLDITAEQTGHEDIEDDLMLWVSLIIGIALSLLGIIFLVLTIYAGYLWMTDRGNDQQVQKAKDILLTSIIGLMVVLGAYAITKFMSRVNIGSDLGTSEYDEGLSL